MRKSFGDRRGDRERQNEANKKNDNCKTLWATAPYQTVAEANYQQRLKQLNSCHAALHQKLVKWSSSAWFKRK
tara:strand:- start:21827 stop:22045 length:219 start_codon:yes stop_codon:yes gene_type:complete